MVVACHDVVLHQKGVLKNLVKQTRSRYFRQLKGIKEGRCIGCTYSSQDFAMTLDIGACNHSGRSTCEVAGVTHEKIVAVEHGKSDALLLVSERKETSEKRAAADGVGDCCLDSLRTSEDDGQRHSCFMQQPVADRRSIVQGSCSVLQLAVGGVATDSVELQPQPEVSGEEVIASDALTCQWNRCGQTLSCLDQLVEHVNEVHCRRRSAAGKGSGYACQWQGCHRLGKGFDARYKLLAHLRIHTSEKPHACGQCGKRFSRLENLKIHWRCHTGEKPYACHFPGCGKAYANSADRFKHLKAHIERQPYRCKWPGCGKSYTDPSSLRKHGKLCGHYHGDCVPPLLPLVLSDASQSLTSYSASCHTKKLTRCSSEAVPAVSELDVRTALRAGSAVPMTRPSLTGAIAAADWKGTASEAAAMPAAEPAAAAREVAPGETQSPDIFVTDSRTVPGSAAAMLLEPIATCLANGADNPLLSAAAFVESPRHLVVSAARKLAIVSAVTASEAAPAVCEVAYRSEKAEKTLLETLGWSAMAARAQAVAASPELPLDLSAGAATGRHDTGVYCGEQSCNSSSSSSSIGSGGSGCNIAGDCPGSDDSSDTLLACHRAKPTAQSLSDWSSG